MEDIDWNLVFEIINAIGSLATFGAFIFLFFKDKHKQGQINKLTEIAVNLKRQNELADQKFKLSIKPKIRIESSTSNGADGTIDFKLKNHGEYAKLIAFNLKSDDVDSHSEHIPFEMDKDTERFFFLKTKGQKHINRCEYEIDIDLEDKAENKYRINILGKGIRIKINSDKEI